jgi:Holliday junction resolvase
MMEELVLSIDFSLRSVGSIIFNMNMNTNLYVEVKAEIETKMFIESGQASDLILTSAII